jgi:phosphoglycolate phosphatase
MNLILFDCDGTLADSQNAICAAMDAAFVAHDLRPPGRARTLTIVGLSLPEAFAALEPDQSAAVRQLLAESYRAAAQRLRVAHTEDPLFEGADATVRGLARRADVKIGMATGKSARGVDRMIAHHGWQNMFQSLQTADGNPSKPHPAMIERAMADTGAARDETVMIGDTTFDMDMAAAAGVRSIGVAWGYHPVDALRSAGAGIIVETFAELDAVLARR